MREIKPWSANALDAAFGAPSEIFNTLPTYDECSAYLKEHRDTEQKYSDLFADWFYGGLAKINFTPRDGINEAEARASIRSLMASFEPQHEHKEALFVVLVDQWFSDVTWEAA